MRFDWARVCREAAIPYVMIVQCNSKLWRFDEQELDEAVSSYTNARRSFCVSDSNLELLRLQVGESLPNGEVAWNRTTFHQSVFQLGRMKVAADGSLA